MGKECTFLSGKSTGDVKEYELTGEIVGEQTRQIMQPMKELQHQLGTS